MRLWYRHMVAGTKINTHVLSGASVDVGTQMTPVLGVVFLLFWALKMMLTLGTAYVVVGIKNSADGLHFCNP